jgi:hypothetical protein
MTKPLHMTPRQWRAFRREFRRSPFGALTILIRKSRLTKRLSALQNTGYDLRYSQYFLLVMNQDMSFFTFSYLHEGHNGTDFRHMLWYEKPAEARS